MVGTWQDVECALLVSPRQMLLDLPIFHEKLEVWNFVCRISQFSPHVLYGTHWTQLGLNPAMDHHLVTTG